MCTSSYASDINCRRASSVRDTGFTILVRFVPVASDQIPSHALRCWRRLAVYLPRSFVNKQRCIHAIYELTDWHVISGLVCMLRSGSVGTRCYLCLHFIGLKQRVTMF